jgi:methylmalonyl-CoA mutase N-terminal domain/subunit
MDEALALPTESAARVALRTQQVIAHESGVVDTPDPLGGSHAIEQLTNEIEEHAIEYLKKIEAMGGMLRAIETGYVQREIQEAAYRYQKAVEAHEQVVVGVNRFQLEREQIERVRALRERRDAQAVSSSLNKLKQAATTDENLLPRILDCVESYATIGEISNTLREIWGEYREMSTI